MFFIAAVEQPVTQNYIISTAGTTGEQTPTNKYVKFLTQIVSYGLYQLTISDATEILTASASESVEVGHQQMDAVQSETEQVFDFLFKSGESCVL